MKPHAHNKEAADAMAAMYVLAAIEGALQNGTVKGGSAGIEKAASKIISICESEIQRQLKRYDFHMTRHGD